MTNSFVVPGEVLTDQQIAYREIRAATVERLKRLQIAPKLLEDMSLFQLIGLLQLMAGHFNYLGTYTSTCWTLEEVVGKALLFDKPSEFVTKPTSEGKPN
jgi:hypothetical protein